MRSKRECTIRLFLAAASVACLLGVSQGWAAPAPQVLKGSAPDPATATGPQSTVAPQQLRESPTKKMGPRQVQSLPKKSNPRAANSAHASMIAALRTQRQAAETERTAILSSQRLAPKGLSKGAATLPPGRTLSDPVPTTPPAGTPPAGTPGTTPPAGTPGTAPPSGTPRGAPTTMAPRGAATGVMKLPSSTVLPPAAAAPPPRSLAGQGMAQGPCTRPTIATVNGQTKGTVFTPDPQFNLYTITGCMFGDRQGQAYIYGAFAAGQVALQTEFWSDTQIVAKVAPQITGELDQSNVTLVVVPSGASMVQKAGFKFYALRETTLLTKIPMTSVNLAQVTDTGGHPIAFGPQGSANYSSPGSYFSGMSAEVDRGSTHVFPGGQDLFDFSKLRPGFTTESMSLNYSVLPNDGDSYQVDGTWNAEWVGDNIRVSWQMQHSHSASFGAGDMDISRSSYGLNVWVNGPKGVSPWPN